MNYGTWPPPATATMVRAQCRRTAPRRCHCGSPRKPWQRSLNDTRKVRAPGHWPKHMASLHRRSSDSYARTRRGEETEGDRRGGATHGERLRGGLDDAGTGVEVWPVARSNLESTASSWGRDEGEGSPETGLTSGHGSYLSAWRDSRHGHQAALRPQETLVCGVFEYRHTAQDARLVSAVQ